MLYFLLHLYNRQFEIYVSSVGLVRELPSIKKPSISILHSGIPVAAGTDAKKESERRLENECKKSNY